VLQVAPSAYRRHAARRRNPDLRSARAKRDEVLLPEIKRVWGANLQVYGARKEKVTDLFLHRTSQWHLARRIEFRRQGRPSRSITEKRLGAGHGAMQK
jgi:hypothetical protein